MKLLSVTIDGIKKYVNMITFDFSSSKQINTISGKNGSGKSTIADVMLMVQQAFLLEKLKKNYNGNVFTKEAEEAFLKKINDAMCKKQANIILSFKDDLGIFRIELEVKDNLDWKIICDDSSRITLDQYWNLENPTNTIVYIESNKHYDETNTPFSEITIKTKYDLPVNREAWLTLNMIFFPRNTFHLLYKNLLMDWAYERLIPTKGKQDLYYKLASLFFNKLFPHIQFRNFSANNFSPDEVVNLVSNKLTNSKRYDMRLLSSGEKTVFYLFLYLNLVERISILLIDEPENHLHEDLICEFGLLLNLLAKESYRSVLKSINIDKELEQKCKLLLSDYSKPKVAQVFFFTHSKVLIFSVFDLGSNFVINENLTLLEYETCEKVLREIGISSVYSRVLFVEGKTELNLFNNLITEHNVKINKLENCDKLIEVYESLKLVDRHLRNVKFVFVVDQDVINNEKVKDIINEGSSSFILLQRHEIENYLIDTKIWKRAIDKLAYTKAKDELTEEALLQEFKKNADSQLNLTKQLYMNTKLRESISRHQKYVKHREIPLEHDTFNQYIDNLFSADKINELKQISIENYKICLEKYDDINWEKYWINLCPGKQVYNMSVSILAPQIGVTPDRLKDEILNIAIHDDDSVFSQLLKLIKEKLEIIPQSSSEKVEFGSQLSLF